MPVNSIKPSLSEQFTGLIWKITLDELNNLVAVETRDTDSRKVSFSVIDYSTGKVYLKEKVFEEPWLLNLVHVGHGNIYLSLFAGENKMFQSSGIIAVDIHTQQITWQNFTVGFWEAMSEGLKVYSTTILPKKYTYLNYTTGSNLQLASETRLFTSIKNPATTVEGDTQFAVGKKLIRSFHKKTDAGFELRLTVSEGDTILIDDMLAEGIQKMQPEAFFLQFNRLFYIRNNRQLVTYLLQ